ncbi:MAG: phospholipid carrier-dependent glycosyltransferase [Fimbriimonadaceae bacterium]|nr:phospholipid carrier-dependent glycosyltransferase [Fimbriimonadaceae bacterium]
MNSETDPWFHRRWPWVLVASIPLLGFWAYGLFDLDEGFYAAVVRDMMRRGDGIVPTLGGKPWFEKPILLYWAAIPSVQAFGPWFGPRLPSVLATIALVAFLGWLVRREGASPATAVLATLSGGTCLLLAAAGRMMLTDSLLTLTLTLCFGLFWVGVSTGARHWKWLAGAALGFSVLAKGPVGGALFVSLAGLTYWREPALRPGFRGGWAGAVLAFAVVVASWYVPAYLCEGDVFVREFLVAQNLGRFSGGDRAHAVKPEWMHPIYYPVVLLVGAAPWSFQAFRRRFWVPLGDAAPFRRYLVRWLLVVLVFFSASGSKLPHYVLPAVPPLAMLAVFTLAEGRRSLRRLAVAGAAGATFLCVLLNAGFVWWYGASGHREVHALALLAARLDPNAPMATYQMSRRDKDLGTGRLRVQETSHPSVRFYFPGPTEDLERLEDLATRPSGTWVLTRSGRIGSADAARLRRMGRDPVWIRQAKVGSGYVLYRLATRR